MVYTSTRWMNCLLQIFKINFRLQKCIQPVHVIPSFVSRKNEAQFTIVTLHCLLVILWNNTTKEQVKPKYENIGQIYSICRLMIFIMICLYLSHKTFNKFFWIHKDTKIHFWKVLLFTYFTVSNKNLWHKNFYGYVITKNLYRSIDKTIFSK